MDIQLSQGKKIELKITREGVFSVLRKISRFLVIPVFFLCILFGGVFWYRYLYAFDWTDEQRQVYRNEYAGETTFREEKFDQSVELLKKRRELHQANPLVTRDIFFGKSL